MDAALQFQLTIAALACSVAALFFSLLAAFPGLKTVLAAVRDGVLWVALFLILGAVAFVVWQQLEGQPRGSLLTKSFGSGKNAAIHEHGSKPESP